MIYLSLGSNLESSFGNRYDNLNTTIELIEKEKIQILKASSFYETPSYPNKDFPPFINIVVEIEYNCTKFPMYFSKIGNKCLIRRSLTGFNALL